MAAVDPGHVGEVVEGVTIAADAGVMADAGAEVAVDFTVARRRPGPTPAGAPTTASTPSSAPPASRADDLDELTPAFTTSNCLVAPNFAIGAVLMMRFAELAAPYFETAEVIELHHDAKADAPSGTAMMTVQRMAGGLADVGARPDPARGRGRGAGRGRAGRHPGALGAAARAGRPPGGAAGHDRADRSRIRHDSYDRTSFMPGVLLAVKQVASRPGVTVGLDALLGL